MHDGDPPCDRSGGSAKPQPGLTPLQADAAGDQPGIDLQALARDWITLWQSELSAAATDRELQESWQILAALWAGAAGAILHGLPRGAPDGANRFPGARPAATARPSAAAAASNARDAEVERLARRVAELERRLAGIDGSDGAEG